MAGRFLKNNVVMLLFFASALLVLLIAVNTHTVMNKTVVLMQDSAQKHLLAAGRAAAMFITPEELARYKTEEDTHCPEYESLRERLIQFGKEYGVVYVYYWRDSGDGRLQYIVDNDTDEETQVTPDDYFDVIEDPLAATALAGEDAVNDFGEYVPSWKGLISAYIPVRDAEGNIVCVAGVDISDEIILTQRSDTTFLTLLQAVALASSVLSGGATFWLYRRKAAQSESAHVAKSRFLSSMSHEMHTPMNAIIGMTALAKTSPDPTRKDYCLEKIESASKHLLGIINDVLDMSKFDENEMELSPVNFGFEKMLRKTVDIFEFQAEDKKQTLSVSVDPKIPELLYGDERRLTQIMMKLLSNAVKFTPDEGKIRVEARLAEETDSACCILVEVSDTGIGIEKEQLSQLFNSFQQTEDSLSRRFGGAGLGLAIAKRTVELMGGKIWVKSESGTGSTFGYTVWLAREPETPAVFSDGAAENEPQPPAAGQDEEEGSFEDCRVLLAEDVEINREIVLSLLEPMGLSIDCAQNGLEAFEKFRASPGRYDMIFMDVQMPEMDGCEATRRIRALEIPEARAVPIVAMSANSFQEDVEACLAAGMNDHVAKPLDLDEVLARLRLYLSKKERKKVVTLM
ncbi:MAG: response regulator [Synergistaceae bacterium]|nr:response regulator [Synergistaceae bacterium]